MGGPALLLGVLARPLFFTNAQDWLGHLWILWHQSLTIRANHLPSLFLHYPHSVFYPEYAFYGGTLYALGGTLSLLLGDAPLATYIATYCLAFMAAYGGWYWMGRMAGLGRCQAQIPGVILITSASYLTIVYARGEWLEFLAVSAMPLMIAATLSIVYSDRLRIWPALALTGSCVVFCGSHNMTLLWGSTVLAMLGLAVIVCVPQARDEITGRRVLRVVSLMVPALLVSAWFLLPELAYSSHIFAGSGYGGGSHYWQDSLQKYMYTVSVKSLFALERSIVQPGSIYFLTLPVAAIVWVLAATAILLRAGSRGPWARVLLILIGMAVLIGLVMTHKGLILALPTPYTVLQFSFRLESYVLLTVSGAVLVALVLAKRSDARRVGLWRWMLLPVLILSVIGAVRQLSAYPHELVRRETAMSSYLKPLLPAGGANRQLLDFYYVGAPTLSHSGKAANVYFPPTAVHGDRASVTVRLRPGEFVTSNVASGPELVHITGARIVGVSQDGNDVLQIDPEPRRAATARKRQAASWKTISLSPAHPLPVVLGRLLTLIGVVALAGRLIALAAFRRRPAPRWRRATVPPPHAPPRGRPRARARRRRRLP
ncbi:MAG TPA: hypothetical protein VFY36_10865 [Solirubrobacteraceae bacterium]|nr:hypothetical protein [Solirubrobacteraceae bacterium]